MKKPSETFIRKAVDFTEFAAQTMMPNVSAPIFKLIEDKENPKQATDLCSSICLILNNIYDNADDLFPGKSVSEIKTVLHSSNLGLSQIEFTTKSVLIGTINLKLREKLNASLRVFSLGEYNGTNESLKGKLPTKILDDIIKVVELYESSERIESSVTELLDKLRVLKQLMRDENGSLKA